MDAKQLAKTNGIGRALIGTALVAAPGLAARTWLGDESDGTAGKVLGRALGVRDLALGAGLLWALEQKEPTHAWLVAAAAADAVDAGATLLAWTSLPRTGRVLVLAVAAGSAIQMGVLAATADR